MSFLNFLLVGLGGAIGAMGRYGVNIVMGQWLGNSWPYGTLTVNIFGGLLMGILVGMGAWIFSAGLELRVFLMVGVLGGFTTFSTFSLEMMMMIEREQWLSMVSYGLVSVIGSVFALWIGLSLVRILPVSGG